MTIRKATPSDFKELYQMGLETKELKVNPKEPFMDMDDFKLRLYDRKHVFLIAQDQEKIVGFICANAKDSDKPLKNHYACLVYIAVLMSERRRGIASMLYHECVKELKKKGITHIYAWANLNSKSAQSFLKKYHFNQGNKFVWVDKRI